MALQHTRKSAFLFLSWGPEVLRILSYNGSGVVSRKTDPSPGDISRPIQELPFPEVSLGMMKDV